VQDELYEPKRTLADEDEDTDEEVDCDTDEDEDPLAEAQPLQPGEYEEVDDDGTVIVCQGAEKGETAWEADIKMDDRYEDVRVRGATRFRHVIDKAVGVK
jgi:hypothetical protein